jgi:hypothetical protein
MSPTTNTIMSARLMACLVAVALIAGCGGGGDTAPDAIAKVCNPGNAAPTYTELYTKYFAAGTHGHCATAECHSDPGHNSWICGPTKATCYNGMVSIGLIDLANPGASKLGDPKASPLNWINPNGPMPQDNPKPDPFPEGRDAIIAWVAACAQNN